MSKSVEDIIELVNIIKNETETNANSAARIASVFLDILEFCKLADTDNAGIMSAEDKAKLNGIAAGAQKNPGVATSASDGLMSRSDKIKLDKCDFFTDEPFRFEPTDDSVELVVDMENHLYEGNYIPVASQTQAGIMTAADKAALDNAPVNINLYNHMSSSKPLPTLHAVFNYYGNLVHFRSVYNIDKWYHIFCVPHQEESGASTMYILYDDTLKFYRKIFKSGLTSDFMWVARAFGDADATTEYSGQMSAADKEKLSSIPNPTEIAKSEDVPNKISFRGTTLILGSENVEKSSVKLPEAGGYGALFTAGILNKALYDKIIAGLMSTEDKAKLDMINDQDLLIRTKGIDMLINNETENKLNIHLLRGEKFFYEARKASEDTDSVLFEITTNTGISICGTEVSDGEFIEDDAVQRNFSKQTFNINVIDGSMHIRMYVK